MAIITETHGNSTSVRTPDGKLIGFIHTHADYASVTITPETGEAVYRTVPTFDNAIALFEALTANEPGEDTFTGDAVTGTLRWDAWTTGDVGSIFVTNAAGADQQYEIALTLRATYDELLKIEQMLAFTIAKLAVQR